MKAIGLVLGALLAAAIACGGATAMKSAAPVSSGHEPGTMPPSPMGGGSRAQIDLLVQKIDADLASLGLGPQAAPANACIQPPCAAEALSVTLVPHGEDPSCRPSPSDTCKDSCKLSDSICDNAGRICRIATDLGGGDAYANEKCAGGKASCDASRGRCCGCQP